jgi:hypothetical protein
MNAMCTGCVIEGYNPITTSFPEDLNSRWTSTVVTATVVTEFTTYNDTVVTNTATLNKTMTVINSGKQTITHTTPTFLVTPKPGTYLTLEAGPTYVIFNTLFGGAERYISTYFAFITSTYETCEATPSKLNSWEPTRTEDWSYFIETHATFTQTTVMNYPLPLPTAALQHLRSNAAILSQFHGHDIMSCTVAPSNGGIALPKPTMTQFPVPAFPTYGSISTQTFLSTTYETTSRHSTVVGCLRIGCGAKPTQDPPFSDQTHDQPSVKEPDGPAKPTDKPNTPNDPTNPIDTNTPNNDGKGSGQPNDQPNGQPNEQRPPGNPVTIGDDVYTVRPGQPTQNPNNPNNHDQPPPVVIIGTETLTRGQTTVINGVPVVVPSDGGGTQIVVGGTTIAVNNGPNAAPVLTIARNPQGQFVVGTETLKPGGPAVTIDGSTLSLGSGGTIAIVNGVTQTLANVPIVTSPPVLTIGDRTVSATVIGGTTQLILNGQILAPGSAITVSGTTYSLPSGPGSIVIVNGATSTLSPNRLATPTVRDGTTAFIFGPDQTLTPGGILTISGTTLSMPLSHSGSVIVINGVTSTLGNSAQITAAPPLTIAGNTYTATVRDGTTEYVIAPGTTLRPGEALTLSGTTYSLDPKGTALVVNGQTSAIARTPASNSASTTKSRNVGDFVWSGIGGGGGGNAQTETSKGGGSAFSNVDSWVEKVVMGIAGWVLLVV